MTERRRRRRIPVTHVMEARLVADGRETRGQVIDLNNAGAFVATDLVLDRNTALQVELQIPGEDKSLPLKAVVARRTSLAMTWMNLSSAPAADENARP